MSKLTLTISDKEGHIRAAKSDAEWVALTFRGEYHEGDCITISTDEHPCFVVARLEDSMESAILYLTEPKLTFAIPFGDAARAYSDKAFQGGKHFLWVRKAREEDLDGLRNLAVNPYFQEAQSGVFPAISANIPANNIRFAARCAIDGCFDTSEHGSYPFTSWSNAQKTDASLTIDFGRKVKVNAVILYLRADFPHDSWWKNVALRFDEEDEMIIHLKRSGHPQRTDFIEKICSRMTLTQLQKADEPALFTALSQIEIIGKD